MSTTPEPIAYKFIGTYMTWLVNEHGQDTRVLEEECQPMYVPIEDEE